MIYKKEDIELEMTCPACPESYDALHEDCIVGYLRLRHGNFTVECGCETVYQAYTKGDGLFDDDEREYHINEAKQSICDYRNRLFNS